MTNRMGKLSQNDKRLIQRSAPEGFLKNPDRRKFMEELYLCRRTNKNHHYNRNMNILNNSDITYAVPINEPGVIYVHELGKPKIKYFPFTGRWDILNPDGSIIHKFEREGRLDAYDFLKWYEKQKTDDMGAIVLLVDDPDLVEGA